MDNDEQRKIEAMEELIEIEVDRARQILCIWDTEVMQKDMLELQEEVFGPKGVPEREIEPPPRDILKREYDDTQKRPRDVAWEKWEPTIEGMIERDMERRMKMQKKLPESFLPQPPSIPKKKDGPEPGMD